ncbi:MAG: DUF4907 domain-containing protein [Bacteriovorax sp.]|nr:DUF4907 domain-containing protein [Bacteriovorax sp.]
MKQKKMVIGIFILVILLIGFSVNFSLNKRYNLETFKVNNGWGYSIYKEKKLIIKQENIPSIQIKKPFATETDAIKIGELMVRKLEKRKTPSITYQELLVNSVDLYSFK